MSGKIVIGEEKERQKKWLIQMNLHWKTDAFTLMHQCTNTLTHSRCISVSIRVLVPNFNVHFGVDKDISPQQSVENLTALMASGVFRNVICVTGKEISYWKNLYFLYWHLMFWIIHIMTAVLILSIQWRLFTGQKTKFHLWRGPACYR